MAKYLIQARYGPRGVQGLLKEGGSKRRKAIEVALKALGGSLEAFYFGFGEADVYTIVELPNNISAASASMAVNASGAIHAKTVVLMSPSDMDEACKKTRRFRAPGE
jgi:uncharacterized protein with GYD domain